MCSNPTMILNNDPHSELQPDWQDEVGAPRENSILSIDELNGVQDILGSLKNTI